MESDSSFTNGAAASESMCRTGETRHARRSGAIWPMRLGTSSPITIEKYVSSTTTSVMPTAGGCLLAHAERDEPQATGLGERGLAEDAREKSDGREPT